MAHFNFLLNGKVSFWTNDLSIGSLWQETISGYVRKSEEGSGFGNGDKYQS